MEQPSTIREWQKMLDDIFGERNKQHHIPVTLLSKLWLYAGIIRGEAKRDQFINPAMLAGCMGRILALSNFFDVDLATALVKKHPPGRCVRCGKPVCKCGAKSNRRDGRRASNEEVIELSESLTLNELAANLRAVYHENNRKRGVEFAIERLLNEITELRVALHTHRDVKSELAAELADAFAWCIAVYHLYENPQRIQDFLWGYYPGKCSMCRKCPCGCDAFKSIS